jgi:hypothetical protein
MLLAEEEAALSTQSEDVTDLDAEGSAVMGGGGGGGSGHDGGGAGTANGGGA